MIVAVVLFSLAPTAKVSAQDDLRLTPEEFDALAASAPMLGKDDISKGKVVSIADIKAMESTHKNAWLDKLSASIAFGNAYGLGAKDLGKLGMNNAPAIEVRVGYALSKYFEVIGGYSSANSFKANSEYYFSPWHDQYNDSFSLSALTIGLKAGVPVRMGKASLLPYVSISAGSAYFNIRHSFKRYENGNYLWGYDNAYNSSGSCDDIGVGAEVMLNKKVRLFYEYSYLTFWLTNSNAYPVLYYSRVTLGGSVRF
jgi:hypothetical protein